MLVIPFLFRCRLARMAVCLSVNLALSKCTEMQQELQVHIQPNQHQDPFLFTSDGQQSQAVLPPSLLPQPPHSFTALPQYHQLRYESSSRLLGSTSADASSGERTLQDQQAQLQDKWLSDRLAEAVNWNRLAVDAAALSRVLTGAQNFVNGEATKVQPARRQGGPADGEILLELLKQSEMLADNLDQLLGMLHRLQREATAEGIGFSSNGLNLVRSTEQALGAAGAFAETLDELASSKTQCSR